MDRAIAAARTAFDDTDWSRDTALRVHCLRQLRDALNDEIELFVADIRELSGDPLLDVEPLRSHAGKLFCHPRHPLLQRVPLRMADLLEYPLAATQLPEEVMAALGAEAVGIMQTLLDTTLEYTKIRKQFGRPLSANQVIRHRLADVAMQVDEARSMALRAALMANAEPVARGRAASGAKAKIGKCARFVAEQAVQLHGGMGYSEEYHVSRYFRESRLMKIAPVSQEMVLNFLGEHVLGLPRSY